MSKNNEPLLDTKKWMIGGIALIIGLFLLNGVINGTFTEIKNNLNNESEPTFYDTGNPEDMTKEELEDYLEWQEKQGVKERNSQKVFD